LNYTREARHYRGNPPLLASA